MSIKQADVVPVNGEHRRCSVLVVEDNPTMRLLLKHVLKTEYEVRLASSVDEALQVAQQRPFDALVLDIQLGEARTGIDLLQQLRQMPAYREVPAVACTASMTPGGRASALKAGFDEYVEKPFSKAQLHEALARVLRSSRGLVAGVEWRTRAPEIAIGLNLRRGGCYSAGVGAGGSI